MASTPENIGVARLVPPNTATLNWPLMVSMISTPVNESASIEISGTSRAFPGSPLWKEGLANSALTPPPAPPWKPRFNGGTTGGLPNAIVSAILVRFEGQAGAADSCREGGTSGIEDRWNADDCAEVARVAAGEIHVDTLRGC